MRAAIGLSKRARDASSFTGRLVIITALITALSCFADTFVVFLGTLFLVLGTGILLTFRPSPLVWPPQWSLRRMFVVVTCFAVLAAAFADQAPFRIRFGLSRSSLERLADGVERGESIELPQRSGLFVVYKADSKDDGRFIRLWIDRSPGEFTGFVRRHAWQPPYQRNEWYSLILDGRWQYFEED